MKKLTALLLVLVLMLGMVACGAKEETTTETTATETTTTETTTETTTTETTTEATETASGDDVLKLMWHQNQGVDTKFENPLFDLQHLGPHMIFEPLIAYEADGIEMTGMLATDWTVSPDGLTYEITIREGVTWHDGEPFTAEDVVWTLVVAATSPSLGISRADLMSIVGAKEMMDAVAEDTTSTAQPVEGITCEGNVVTLKLNAPNKLMLDALTMIKIMPKHVYGDMPMIDLKSLDTYIGTGPYCLDEVKFPDYYTVKAYEGYWGEQPGISKAQFTSYAAGGSDAAINAMITGDLDFVYRNDFNDINIAENIVSQNPDCTYAIQSANYCRAIALHQYERSDGKTKEDLKKPEVRQAFNLLLDKAAMASIYAGQASPMTTWIPDNSPLYNSDIPVHKRDVAAAKALLDSVGFDYSQVYDLYYYYSDQNTIDLMAYVKQNFAEAGVQVETHFVDGAELGVIEGEGNWDMEYYGASHNNAVAQYMRNSSNGWDFGNLEGRKELYDPDYFAWLATTDETESRKYSDALQATHMEDMYVIVVYTLNSVATYNSRVHIPDILRLDNDHVRNWHWNEWSLG